MDLRARATAGFWPVITVRSLTAPSMSLASRAASPTPMLTTILVSAGTCMTFGVVELLAQRGGDLVGVALLQPRHRALGQGRRSTRLLSISGGHQMSLPLAREIRTFFLSSSTR